MSQGSYLFKLNLIKYNRNVKIYTSFLNTYGYLYLQPAIYKNIQIKENQLLSLYMLLENYLNRIPC